MRQRKVPCHSWLSPCPLRVPGVGGGGWTCFAPGYHEGSSLSPAGAGVSLLTFLLSVLNAGKKPVRLPDPFQQPVSSY